MVCGSFESLIDILAPLRGVLEPPVNPSLIPCRELLHLGRVLEFSVGESPYPVGDFDSVCIIGHSLISSRLSPLEKLASVS